MADHLLDSANSLKEELYRQLSRIGKCLSSDKRLEILTLLSQGSKTVEKLASTSGMNFANVSRHLQILLDAKLVRYAKRGNHVVYSLADPAIVDFLNSLWRISIRQLPDIARIKDRFIDRNLDGIQTLTMDEVMEKMNAGSVFLLDLRPTEEYETGHIAGAISVPFEELERYMQAMPQEDAGIIAYCRGPLCVYSAIAAQKLQAGGFKAYRMDEGFHEWQEHFRLQH